MLSSCYYPNYGKGGYSGTTTSSKAGRIERTCPVKLARSIQLMITQQLGITGNLALKKIITSYPQNQSRKVSIP
jgi:hypothetical protein